MIKDEIKIVIQERINTDDEWDYGIEQCWKKEVEILSRNIQDTIVFLENDCTADEFSWLSEIFDKIVEATLSVEFVNTLRKVAAKFPEECEKYNVIYCIDIAEGKLDYLLHCKKD